MKRFVCACLLLSTLYALDAHATNWYVRAGAGGSGTSWTDAWSDVTNIVWASTAPGDTIWIAGGRYGTLTLGKSGNADSVAGRIFIKRATVAAHGGETGWSAGYDTQVELTSVVFNTLNLGSYVTIDGQRDRGIVINVPSGGTAAVKFQRGATFVTLRYLDLAGPCGSSPCTVGADIRGVDATASGNESIANLTIQHNKIHGLATQMWLFNTDNALIEDNELYDNMALDSVTFHPNQVFTAMSNNVTFRRNILRNYGVEGILMKCGSIWGTSGTWYIYSNLFYRDNGASGGPTDRVVEANGTPGFSSVAGPVYFYNNTIVGLWNSWTAGNDGQWHPNTVSRNNIYWKTPSTAPFVANQSYDFCSGTCPGSNSASNGSNPFVNLSGGNFHIVSTVGATYPKDKGINLGLPYNVDMDGILRGGDGTWDIGAYEYVSGNNVAPNPPTDLRVQ